MVRLVSLASLVVFTPACQAAVFQFAAQVPAKKAKAAVFLWLPHKAERVRGVVVAGMTLAERELVKDEAVRKACAAEGLAVVFVKAGLAAVDVQGALDALAKKSGYRELSVAPLFFLGHSAGGPQAKAAAVKYAARCFGVVQYRGGYPGGDQPVPPGVPALMMLGQFDEFGGLMRDAKGRENWENGRDSLAAFRKSNAANLGSLVVEPGAGHFAWSARNGEYLALFIRKAARARIPDWKADAKKPVLCKEVMPESGWLSGLALGAGGPAAAYADYKGDRKSASWHFDREMAEATLAYHKGLFGKKDQFIRWKDPHWVDAGARFFFHKVAWVGPRTFEVHPAYADAYPGQYKGKGPRWPLAGKPAGHSKAAIEVRPVGGPVVAAGRHRLRVEYDALVPATEPGRVTFLAFSPGDKEYRHAEQVGMMPRGFSGLKEGKEQTISFPPLKDVKADAGPVILGATSDSKLPVDYYVAHGPAVVEGGRLRLAEVPARAAYPIEVKVVAYQFGSGVAPLVKTAAPAERTFRVLKP